MRAPEEFHSSHLPGSISASGGQVVQAVDRWVGTRGARLVLVDDTGTRAIMTAHWLKQMGWDVQILDRALQGLALEIGTGTTVAAALPAMPVVEPAEAACRLAQGAGALSVEASSANREAHPQGAVWGIRPRLDRLPAPPLSADHIVLFADDEALAALAGVDLSELTSAQTALVRGGTEGWAREGLSVVASPDHPPDAECIDYVFWSHERHASNRDAMRAYLRWETELPAQIAADGLSGFRQTAS